MIAVVAAQIAARWGQALVLLALSVVVTAAAVSVPLYAASVDRAGVADELAAGDGSDLVVSVGSLRAGLSGAEAGTADPPDGLPTTAAGPPEDLVATSEARGELALFTPVTTVRLTVRGVTDDAEQPEVHRLLARDGFCDRVTFRHGRCPVGGREAALPVALAGDAGVGPGEAVVLTPVRAADGGGGWVQDGPPASIVLVGVFEPADPADPYWAAQDPLGRQPFLDPAILTNRTTVQTMPHGQATYHVDAVLPPHLLRPERIPEIRRQLDAAARLLAAGAPGSTVEPVSTLPRLLDRIDGHGDQARALLPIAVTPLVLLGWFVVYVAAGDGVAGRRREVAAVAIRGATRWTRAATVAAESVLPLVVAAPAGLVVAHVAVEVVGPDGAGPLAVDGAQLVAAGIATAGTIVAALLAAWRQVAGPLVQLLREVPPRRRRLAVAAVEILVVALGGLVVAERWAADGDLVGAMVAAPAAVILAVAVVASWVIQPIVRLAGSWSLRRGRLAPAMAALYLARRPGAARLVIVVALVFGTLGFAVASSDVAAQARTVEAERMLGAARVLQVQQVGRRELLQAVRAADPSGRYAMAVVSAPGSGPPVVAVDTSRLADVASWSERYGGTGPAQVAELLRPPADEPAVVRDGELVAELSPAAYTPGRAVTVSVLLSPAAGDPVVARFGPVTAGRRAYRAEVSGCPDGCRLAAVVMDRSDTGSGSLAVTFHALDQDDRAVLPLDRLTDLTRWRNPEDPVVGALPLHAEAAPDGLLLQAVGPEPADGYTLLALDVPYPLPVVSTGDVPELVTGLDDRPIKVASQAGLDGLPGVGAAGLLMDLEYAERLTAGPGDAEAAEVWLAEDAPAGIADQLREQGLTIVDDRAVDDVQAVIDRSGAATALRFHTLSAGATILVGLAAFALLVAVDRHSWSRGLRALRVQGLTDRTTSAAARWSYGAIIAAGAVAGLLAGATAWLVLGGRLPLGVDESLLTLWPRWTHALLPWLLAVAVLVTAALAGAGILRRRTPNTEGG